MSIGNKFTLWVVSILLVVGTVTVSLFYVVEVREESSKLDTFGRLAGRIIEENIIEFMLKRDPAGLNKELEEIKKGAEGISRILLLNKDGVVKAGTDRALIDRKFSIHDAGCRECHEKGREGLLVSGEDTYRWATPVANKPACRACHPATSKNNGLLIIDFSIADVQHHVRQEILGGFFIFVAAMTVIGVILISLTRVLVTRRLYRMNAAMKDFREGNTAVRAAVEGRDELAQLETGFNELAQAITVREREKNELLARLNDANEKLQQEISERARGEQALREQKLFADSLIENTAVAAFVIDPRHRVVLWNRACGELTGVRAADMIGTDGHWSPFYSQKRQTLADVIIDGNIESLPALYRKHARSTLTREGLQAEGWYENLNGKDRYIIFDAAPIYDGRGSLIAVIETLQDITPVRLMERELAKRENLLRTIINTEPECVKLISAEGALLDMNPAGLAMIEADSLEQVAGHDVSSLVVPEHRPAFQALSARTLQGESDSLEFEITGFKGTRRWLETHTAPLRNEHGEIVALLGVTRDIAERKRWEHRLREQLKFLQLLIDTIPIPVFYKDANAVYLGCNKAFEEFLGISKEQVIGKSVHDIAPGELADINYGKDRELFDRPGVQVYEHPVKHADGTIRDVIFSQATYTDAQGDVAGLLGVMLDITDRKRMETALRQSNEMLQAVIQASPLAVVSFDAEGNVGIWNKAAERIFGWRAEEVISRFNPLVTERTRPEFLDLLRRVLGGGLLMGVGLKRRRKDETLIDVSVSSAPLRNANNDIVGIMSVISDITEQKRTAEKILASERKYRELFESATDAIFLHDLAGNFIDVNRAAYSRLGYTKEEMLALNIRKLVAPEFAARVPERLAQMRERGAMVFESAHRKKDGTPMLVEVSARMTEYEGKAAYLSFVRDISERKKAELIIQRNYDSQTAINWILHISLENISLESILRQTLDLVLSIPWLSFESRGSIFLVEGDPAELVMKAQRGLSEPHRELCRTVPLGTCLCGRAAARGEVQFADTLDDRHQLRYEGIVPHGHYCIPIRHAKTVVGVINLYLREGHEKDDREIEFLNAIASALAGIIQRKRAEEERESLIGDLRTVLASVSHSKKEWQDTFDSITEMICIVDTGFTILKANRAFSEYFGLHPSEVINRKCHEFVPVGEGPIPGSSPEATPAGNNPAQHEFFDKRTNRTFHIATFPYQSPEGQSIGIIHIMRDITDTKEKEMRLIMSERLAALGQMASGIAHEINNPLASIAGCSEGLLKRIQKGQCDTALFESYLNIIQEEVFRCKNITTAMLSFVRKGTYEKKDLDLGAALDKTVEIIGFQGRLKHITIERKYDELMPAIHGNEGELRQVLLIVITNALDAMGDEGTLTLETTARDDGAVIRISDTGGGIPPDIIDRIFDPFFTTKTERGGTGLGLSIASKIVANHDGRIEAASSDGKGTTITISLPR